MEEKSLSEKESLELIARMIRSTQRNLVSGSGNVFLSYGYTAVVLSVVVFGLNRLTGNPMWNLLWLAMFVPMLCRTIGGKRPEVVTYTDATVGDIWRVVSALFCLTLIAIPAIGLLLLGQCGFSLMLPLCLLYAGIGTSVTGVVTKVPSLVYTPFVAFAFAMYMLMVLAGGGTATAVWHLYFGLSFLAMMVIPGHVLNRKTLRTC